MSVNGQLSLLGRETPSLDAAFGAAQRIPLAEGAWVEYVPGWLRGHADVFEALASTTAFRTQREPLYDRVVEAPRRVATLPDDGPGHAILEDARRLLSRRFGDDYRRLSLALYRDGRDSVAWHGDRIARQMDTTTVATLSLGAPRTFLLRPLGGGRSIAFEVGFGDLVVMGGTCQRTWQHSVPKRARAEPRIAVMFRPVWEPA